MEKNQGPWHKVLRVVLAPYFKAHFFFHPLAPTLPLLPCLERVLSL